MPRFARTGNRPETPGLLAGLAVVGVDKTANASFTAADTNDDVSSGSQRSHSHAVTRFVIEHSRRPALGSTLQIEGHEVAIESSDKKFVIQNRRAAIGVAKADGVVVRRNRTLPAPEHAAGSPIHRASGVRSGDVQDAVNDDGRNFVARVGKLESPFDFEAGNILRVDFRKWGETMTLEIARIGEPVARFLVGAYDALERHLRESSAT